MGAVGGMLGLNGGAGGTGFNTQAGANAGQLNTAYQGNQAAMGQQQGLLNALQGQNGIQNQSNVYNQLQGVVSGQGPNPAQAQLANATGANVANQAAMMAGQRGAGANAGLMARQAAQTGANIQQQAAGQGASMQAQQSLGALGQAGDMAGNMVNNQIGQTNANVSAQQNEQNILQNANTAHNNIQGQLANTTLGGQQKLIGGAMNAVGGAAGLFAEGGAVSAFGPQSKFGQFVNAPAAATPTFSAPNTDPMNFGHAKKPNDPMSGAKNITPTGSAGSGMSMPVAAGGGKVPAMVSPGEKFLKPHEAKAVAQGKVSPNQVGEQIPGQAKVKGDSYKNDVVRKDLEPGGVVLPRSVMNSKDPEKSAAAFVRSVLAKKGKKK